MITTYNVFLTLFLMFDLLIHMHTYRQSVGLVSGSVEGSRSVVFLHVSDCRKGHLVREDKAQHTQNHTRLYTFPQNLSMKFNVRFSLTFTSL